MTTSFYLAFAVGALASLLVGLGVGFVLLRRERHGATGVVARAAAEAERLRLEAGREAERVRAEAAQTAERLRVDAAREAAREAEAAKAAAILEGRMEVLRQREELDRETQRRRDEFERAERRLEERARGLDRKAEELDRQEQATAKREQALVQRELDLRAREGEIDRLVGEQRARLERIAGLGAEEARREIFQRVEDEARSQAAALARDIREQARRGAEREARRIISMAIQRLGAEHTAESTVSAVALPSDEMKGRIIGREGRNIRAFETATGVDLIIDDTPDTVIVSCFDPIRREVARRALEALILDGRIHPGRIEEVVQKVQKELDAQIVELGEQAAYETGVHGLHPELIKLVGRMRYRTSYGQNILDHSKEVAHLAGAMAAELHLDVQLAKRGGLLHDVGKVLTHDSELTHVELGVEVARKYGETPLVINAIQAHHDDVPHETAESVLVQAADAISGSRPGARREAFETYVKRLTKLEEIANSFKGVEKSNVIQAGREIRVVVTPEQVDDAQAAHLSETIARRIENELQYPGQIRVVVIRETRAVDYAK